MLRQKGDGQSPSGLRGKSPMTVAPIDSRLRGKDGRFCKGLLMGEGILSVGVGLFTRITLPPCGYCLKASMTVGFAKVLVRGYYFWYCKSMFMENEAI